MFVHEKNVTSTRDNYSFSDGYTCQIFLMIEVFQMLQKARTHAMPLGYHVTQQKLTGTAELKHQILAFSGSFSLVHVYSALFGCHSGSFRYIPVPFLFIPSHSGVILPHSGIFWFILVNVYSVPFHSVPVFSNALHQSLAIIKSQEILEF